MSQLSLACSVFLSPYCMDRWGKGQQAGKDRLLSTSAGAPPLSYSWSTAAKAARAAEPPLASSLQLSFPANSAICPQKTWLSPPLSSVKRWGNQSRASSKGNRRVTGWSLNGNNRRGGLMGQQKGGELKGTNWESLPRDSSARHNNRDKKVPPATADYHLHSPTQTHTHRHMHPRIVWPMKGCTGVLGMSSVTQ